MSKKKRDKFKKVLEALHFFQPTGASEPGFLEGVSIPANYQAFEQADGNFTIKNLDGFTACARAASNGKHVNFDERWLDSAIMSFNERKARDSYLPPVHLDHHNPKNPGVSRTFAGHIGNMRKELDRDGVPTILMDLVDMPPEIFSQIQAKRLPYRSVEVNNPNVAEISSLALTSTAVPFHKYALTRVELVGKEENAQTFNEDPAPTLFMESKKGRIVVAQKFNAEYAPFGKKPEALYFSNSTDDSVGRSVGQHLKLSGKVKDEPLNFTQNKTYMQEEEEEIPEDMILPEDDILEEGILEEDIPEEEMIDEEMTDDSLDPESQAALLEMLGLTPEMLDEEDQALLNETGDDQMSKILEAIGTIAEGMQTLNAKIDATNVQAPVQASPIPPVVSTEPEVEKIHFSEDKLEFNEASFHALVATNKSLVDKVNKLEEEHLSVVKFCQELEEGMLFSEWQQAQGNIIEGEMSKMNFTDDEQKTIAFSQAYEFGVGQLEKGTIEPDYKTYFENLNKLGVGTNPLPPKADEVAPTATSEVDMVQFVEASPDLKQYFTETRLPLTKDNAKIAVEAQEEWEKNYKDSGATWKYYMDGAFRQ